MYREQMKHNRGSRSSLSRLSRLTQTISKPNLYNTNEAKNTVVQKNLELDFEINEAVLNIEQLKMDEFKKMRRIPFITVSLFLNIYFFFLTFYYL